ncbi:hypothetical protein IP88_04020 [alpha proteobacterium AAP81b]|nr:hypothetical protein IP88_04020 [alpha proteobacterium AAP81b]
MVIRRHKGWDKQAVNTIAARDYGGLEGLFAAHGWTLPKGRTYGQVAPTLVTDAYGSIAAFEAEHPAAFPDPVTVIEADDPDVWLGSFFGFVVSDKWGMIGFTRPADRDKIRSQSRPGALYVAYGVGRSENPAERMRVLGMVQLSHVIGTKHQFLHPSLLTPATIDRWYHGLKVVRAWSVPADLRPDIRDFAPEIDLPRRAREIGVRGIRLPRDAARRLLALDMIEVPVYGGPPVAAPMLAPGAVALRPSKAGPIAQTGFWTEPATGPKHLYMLRLNGNLGHFVPGHDWRRKVLVKVGISISPAMRCASFNSALPATAFNWELWKTTHGAAGPFDPPHRAKLGEDAMKTELAVDGEPLGGEFFLASDVACERAWRHGCDIATAAE